MREKPVTQLGWTVKACYAQIEFVSWDGAAKSVVN